METVLDSLQKHHINFEVFDNVRVEPTDKRYSVVATGFSVSDFVRNDADKTKLYKLIEKVHIRMTWRRSCLPTSN